MNLSDLLCDLYDVKKQAKLHKFGSLPKDNEGTETTIDDCLDNIIEQLEEFDESEAFSNNININQYIEYDEGKIMRIYFKKAQFLEDACEYLQNDHSNYEIVEV